MSTLPTRVRLLELREVFRADDEEEEEVEEELVWEGSVIKEERRDTREGG
jgi:hypothetical protein